LVRHLEAHLCYNNRSVREASVRMSIKDRRRSSARNNINQCFATSQSIDRNHESRYSQRFETDGGAEVIKGDFSGFPETSPTL